MKTTYLVCELRKWLTLQDQRTDAFLDSISANSSKHDYIRSKVLPVIEKDCSHQLDVVVKEAERLLKEKNERWKRQTNQS